MTIITKDTVWRAGSSINLRGQEVQVANGVKLTIEAGAKVSGGTLAVYGELSVRGTAKSKVEFNDIKFEFGSDHDTPGRINLTHSLITGGSFLEATGNGSYGSFNLSNNTFNGVKGFYIWYPTLESSIDRNVFNGSQGLSVGLDDTTNLTVTRNVFYDSTAAYNSSSDAAIVSWASYGGADTFTVKYNTFIVGEGDAALELADGYNNTGMLATSNYYYTVDERELRKMVLDRSDSLTRASHIQDTSPLTQPNKYAPVFEVPEIIGAAGGDLLQGTYAKDIIRGSAGNDAAAPACP